MPTHSRSQNGASFGENHCRVVDPIMGQLLRRHKQNGEMNERLFATSSCHQAIGGEAFPVFASSAR